MAPSTSRTLHHRRQAIRKKAATMGDRKGEVRAVRRPAMDRRWTAAIEARVLDIIARTGSPKRASEATGISTATIHDHRRRDFEFGARYNQAMDSAFHEILGKAFDRSLADEEPSDRLIEVLLKFRWPERLNNFLSFTAEGGAMASAPAGLAPPRHRADGARRPCRLD
ncbi:hypothetical protein [Aureimonas populi]|uniref:TetR/AcrR family transcriptional regulator n=1 Tax=Aureimonas populi TaxID=1701758 RepID=A0ABW5CKC4_9HYPH|nr:hypothetical protein [Aureimonas populi]